MKRRLGARARIRLGGDLAAAEDTASLAGSMRVGAWMRPSKVVLANVDGAPALTLHYEENDRLFVREIDARDALARLCRLATAPDIRIRDFVHAFGSLFEPDDAMGVGYPEVPFDLPNDHEWLSNYRAVASTVAAMTRVTALVRRQRPVAKNDLQLIWLALETWAFSPLRDYTVKVASGICSRLIAATHGDSVPFEDSLRRVPAGFVNWWLRAKDVRPIATWSDTERPNVAWTGDLWGHIGAQLLLYIRGGENTADCDGCGRQVHRQRRPKSGQQVWCRRVQCQRKRARIASEKSRKRARGKTRRSRTHS